MGNSASNTSSQAVALFDQGKFEEAHPLFESVFRSQRAKSAAASGATLSLLRQFGVTCEETGRFERGREVWLLRQKMETQSGLSKREDTAVSRFGLARCELWLGRFDSARSLLDACLLDVVALGNSVRLCLVMALFFGGAATEKARQMARQCVEERAQANPPEQVLALMCLYAIAGEEDVLKKVYSILALSMQAKDGVANLCHKNLAFLNFEMAKKVDVRAALCVAKFQITLLERLELRVCDSSFGICVFYILNCRTQLFTQMLSTVSHGPCRWMQRAECLQLRF
jgi:hypothetical protein